MTSTLDRPVKTGLQASMERIHIRQHAMQQAAEMLLVGFGKTLGLGLGCAVEVFHVARHLHDPEAAVGRELQDRWVADERSLGDEFDAIARRDLEAAERLLGGQRRRRRDEVRRHDRHLRLTGLVPDLRAQRGHAQAEGGEE